MSGYSERWRRVFGEPTAARTAADIEFLQQALPLPAFRSVLDIACGQGRHKRALETRGYEVVGVDNDPAVCPDVVADMRDLRDLPRGFDAVISMWASFGYFDSDENMHVLGGFAERVRPRGRVILDLYNRSFFDQQGSHEREVAPGVIEQSTIAADRRQVELRYNDGQADAFDWQLFSPADIRHLAAPLGLFLVTTVASPDAPMMQLVLERERAR